MEVIERFSAFNISTEEIYIQPQFNCREVITPISVEELSKSIEKHGLQFPVVVQNDVILPDGYKYRLIVGFRRFTACTQFLKWTHIPANIRSGLTNTEARVLNLLENIDRKDLNILEEAHAIRTIFPEGTTIAEIANSVRRHYRWCVVRLELLKMAPEIQQAAANGITTQGDIYLIQSVPADSQRSVFKSILASVKSRKSFSRKKLYDPRPTSEEVRKRVETLVHGGFGGFVGRLLLWAAGLGIENAVIDQEIENVMEKGNRVSMEELLGVYNENIKGS